MRGVVGIVGDPEPVLGRLRARLEGPVTVVAATRAVTLATVGPAAPVGPHATTSGEVTAASLGTAWVRPAATGDLAALPEQLLGAGPLVAPDVVAVALDRRTDSLHASAGAGPHQLFSVRDDGRVVALATSLEAAAAAAPSCAVDRSREDFLLGFGFVPAPATVLAGVEQLGSDLAVTLTADGTLLSTPRAAAPGPDVTGLDLVGALQAAVTETAAGRDRHAVLLGGFDSALVAALLRRAGSEVVAYTFRFPDDSMNQRNVDLVVDALGIEHEWVDITPAAIGEHLRSLPRHINGPTAQPHYQLHTVVASRRIRADGFELVFTGDGCDSLFLGYPTVHMRSRLGTRLRRLPPAVARLGIAALSPRAVEARLGHVARVGRSALRASLLPWPAAGHLPTQYLDEVALARLRGDQPVQVEDVTATRVRLAEGLAALDDASLAYRGNAMTGASGLKVDGAVASTGLGHWTPYTDPRVRAIAAGLAAEELRRPGERADGLGKAALIDAVLATDLLPREVVLQPKQSPATAPIDEWYRGPLRPVVDELLTALPFDVDRAAVEEVLRPKRVEDEYRRRVTLSHHAYQAIGLLCSYGAVAALTDD